MDFTFEERLSCNLALNNVDSINITIEDANAFEGRTITITWIDRETGNVYGYTGSMRY